MESTPANSSNYVSAKTILERALSLVTADRKAQHGDMLKNHQAIAHLWNGYLTALGGVPIAPLLPTHVADMMELLKVARRLNGSFNKDDYEDGAGYAAIAGEIASRSHQ